MFSLSQFSFRMCFVVAFSITVTIHYTHSCLNTCLIRKLFIVSYYNSICALCYCVTSGDRQGSVLQHSVHDTPSVSGRYSSVALISSFAELLSLASCLTASSEVLPLGNHVYIRDRTLPLSLPVSSP